MLVPVSEYPWLNEPDSLDADSTGGAEKSRLVELHFIFNALH
jgi:hypothetical protein